MDSQKPNKPLFSQHYLQYRIQASPEWQVNLAADFQKLKKLYISKQDLLPTLNEDQTEEEFIKPVLKLLGFSYITQVTTRGKGRAERPDYALFNNESDRDFAYTLKDNETAFYNRVVAIAEAKYWERPLSKVSANDKRDIYKNENPSFQITNYLIGTSVDWGILTNGREWRLYYRLASSKATEFYHIDLVDILQTEDLEEFKYFWLFFRQEAFIKDAQGKNFLERVREGSNIYATRVGNELKALVFDSIFPDLAGGFVSDANRRGETVTSAQVYEATLSFLYKLLFLLYAEARNLLPIDSDYRDHSLIKLTQEVAQIIEKQKKLSQTSTGMYDKLLSLFQIVDRGDVGLEVPRYNGGLFHFDFQQKSQQIEYPANYFLSQFKITDAILAPVLDKLARFEGQPIDYSFLGVRQLGSIYEGLLEYRIIINYVGAGSPTNYDSSQITNQNPPPGVGAGSPTNYDSSQIAGKNPPLQVSVHLENDKGERKATGSYYTPEYIVKYIVSHTIKPILEQRQTRFSELMAEISDLHNQMQDKRLGVQSINGLRKKLQRLEREAQSTLLDIKICDPAMGSGHFLVEAVDYLTDELIGILTQYPEHNPVLEMLDKTRESILENLQQQGIRINGDKLEPTQLLQRVVMKRCIYGVDLNPMAVELAKVSLWLHSFTIGAPLSFLDHHLRCGNSLIGTTAKEAEAKMTQEESGQLSLLTGPFVGLLKAAEIMRGVSVLSDATFAEVEQSERLFRSFDEAAKPYKRLLAVYVSQFFGVKQAKNYLERLGVDAITANPEKMKDIDKTVYEAAQKLAEEKRFFHWDLEFPEVFIDLENASWNEKAGFDIVVGNPPWGGSLTKDEKNYFSEIYKDIHLRTPETFNYFIKQAIISINKNTGIMGFIIPNTILTQYEYCKTREILIRNYKIEKIINLGDHVFIDVIAPTSIIVISAQNYINNVLDKTEYLDLRDVENKSIALIQFKPNVIAQKLFMNNIHYSLIAKSDSIFLIQRKIDLCSYKLNEVCKKIATGISSGLDKAYCMTSEQAKLLDLETEVIRKLLTGTATCRYEEKYNDNPEIILYITSDVNIKEYPNTEKYLRQFYDQLCKRREADQGKIDWFVMNRPRDKTLFTQAKIFIRQTSDTLIATYNNTGLHCLKSVIVVQLKDNINLSYFYLLSLINSQVLNYYHRDITQENDRIFSEVKPINLEKLPIRKINFTTPADRVQQDLDNAIGLYRQYQNDRDFSPILNQVNHHLSQQPEEADVIHDLLAYLAEQMLELNQQKQGEIKSFLQWLERFIGCPIDTLTNKSKIQNYLGDYYKEEPHLSFEELIEILKKNKKKVKIDPVARKEQQTLEKEYQASLDTLLPIKMQLTRCDKLIDRIVYQLYGLTEEEIAIVEGK